MATAINVICNGCPEKSIEQLHKENLQFKMTVYYGGIVKMRMYFFTETEAKGVATQLKASGLKTILLEKIMEVISYDTKAIDC